MGTDPDHETGTGADADAERYVVVPVGRVESDARETADSTGAALRGRPATVVVDEAYAEALTGFDERVGTGPDALLDVVFYCDGVEDDEVELAGESGHGLSPPGRGGVFTRRTPRRPNRLGLTTVRVVERDGLRLRVEGLDALDGTPVLDLKPHVDWVDRLD
jgi:tRNA (Thr-GGU) A37 N-methylase